MTLLDFDREFHVETLEASEMKAQQNLPRRHSENGIMLGALQVAMGKILMGLSIVMGNSQ